jgi:hypothetical protein
VWNFLDAAPWSGKRPDMGYKLIKPRFPTGQERLSTKTPKGFRLLSFGETTPEEGGYYQRLGRPPWEPLPLPLREKILGTYGSGLSLENIYIVPDH